MRYIFLDIDGVIATDATYVNWRRRGSPMDTAGWVSLIDPAKMKMVNDFGHEIRASVIVSSTWRVLHVDIGGLLRQAGLTLPVVGQTGADVGHRGLEINDYIVQQGLALTDFVIFDDDAKAPMSPAGACGKHGARVIRTPENTGLNTKLIDRARKLFG